MSRRSRESLGWLCFELFLIAVFALCLLMLRYGPR